MFNILDAQSRFIHEGFTKAHQAITSTGGKQKATSGSGHQVHNKVGGSGLPLIEWAAFRTANGVLGSVAQLSSKIGAAPSCRILVLKAEMRNISIWPAFSG